MNRSTTHAVALAILGLLPVTVTAAPSPAAVAPTAATNDPLEARERDRTYCLFLRFFADELLLFPEWDPVFYDTPPATVGPFAVSERQQRFVRGADGCPLDITVFEPVGLDGPKPAFVWVQGSNVQPYYQQSLHETLASWGYVVIVADTRPLTFVPDPLYHSRNVDNARLAINRALNGRLGVEIDGSRIAAGGYSIGGSMATFLAAEDDRVAGTVLWAPTSSPFWSGVEPDLLWPQVTAPTHLLLGELDPIAPPDGFPAELQAALINSPTTVEVIAGGTHLYFQQPTGADSPLDPVTDLTRFEQQGIAIEATRAYLDQLFGLPARATRPGTAPPAR